MRCAAVCFARPCLAAGERSVVRRTAVTHEAIEAALRDAAVWCGRHSRRERVHLGDRCVATTWSLVVSGDGVGVG